MVYDRKWLVCLLIVCSLCCVASAQTPTLAQELKVATVVPEPVNATVAATVSVLASDAAESSSDDLEATVIDLKRRLAEAEVALAEKGVAKTSTLAPSITTVSIIERRPTPVLSIVRATSVLVPRPLDDGGFKAVSSYSSATRRHYPYILKPSFYGPYYHFR